MNNSGNETKIQYRIPRTILNENKRLWNENNQLKQRINELEEEIIKANKEIRSLNALFSKRDKSIREMNQEILRLMVENVLHHAECGVSPELTYINQFQGRFIEYKSRSPPP